MQPLQRRRFLQAAACTVAAPHLGAAMTARDDTYPSRPLRLVVGFPAGGSADQSSRRLADQLARQLGQPVIVDNRPGASGNIAAAVAARSAPDGYTLFYGTNATHAMNVSLYPKLDYDPVKDFAPIALEGKVYNVLCVNPAFEARDLGSFIAMAKAKPERIAVATPGNATSGHLSLVLLDRAARVRLAHIPYKGSAPALNDVLGGQVPAIFDNVAGNLAYIRSEKIRPLAVTSRSRLPLLPQVPTFEELGLPDCEIAAWGGLWAPGGTPAPLIDRLNQEVNRALQTPAVADRMRELTIEPQGGTPQALADFARSETLRWREVIRAAAIRLD
ncbi:tripartite tricarboxylate transporter substrate binding protein [Variovorax atrisoli]|uniref:Bug family tripartite tricarboxylate transporter substrate binding protein n=1 Tax=Variovorax atrisoli TaxID=3394203 RepID=UPI000F7F0B51|nr:tripartite tricarboxylate transporter substrate binding protein [Variovorax sp. 369]RTD86633.1 tripartite tricarboxylate transporter substrate binding protein [Variovorax sp. 369]